MDVATAAAHFGSRTRLASALGISPAAVSQWGSIVPTLRQYQLERLTGGALKADPFKAEKVSPQVSDESSAPDGSVHVSSVGMGAL